MRSKRRTFPNSRRLPSILENLVRRANKGIQSLLERLTICSQLLLRFGIIVVARLVDLVASRADIRALNQTRQLLE